MDRGGEIKRPSLRAGRKLRGSGSVRDGNLWRELLDIYLRATRIRITLPSKEEKKEEQEKGSGERNERSLIRNRRGLRYCRARARASGILACFFPFLSFSLSAGALCDYR